MASHVGLSPGQGTKMAHTMGQLSLCAANGEPVHLSEDTGQPNKQKTQTTTTKTNHGLPSKTTRFFTT